MTKFELYTKIKNDYAHSPYRPDTAPDMLPDEEEADVHKDSSASWILISAIAGIVLVSFILLAAARLLLQRRRYRRMNTKERYFSEFGSVMLVLAEIGIKRSQDETLAEFGERAAVLITAQDGVQSEVTDCIGIHEKCIYGSSEPDEGDTVKLQTCRKKLETYMKEYYGKTYLFHRLHLLMEKSF